MFKKFINEKLVFLSFLFLFISFIYLVLRAIEKNFVNFYDVLPLLISLVSAFIIFFYDTFITKNLDQK